MFSEWKCEERERGSGVGVKPPCRAPGSTEYRAHVKGCCTVPRETQGMYFQSVIRIQA